MKVPASQVSLFGEPLSADRNADALRAPFPYFGGKSGMASLVWYAFGDVKQYIEPFCGSAAVLLGAPKPASLEVVGDVDCFIANFWRAVKHQPEAVAREADYPVSHLDLAARHRWLVEPTRVQQLADALTDPEWSGDAKIAGWWCWGQCAWIGSGWCDSRTDRASTARSHPSGTPGADSNGQIPHTTNAGRGMQRRTDGRTEHEPSQIPFLSSTGMGLTGGSFDGASIVGWMRQLANRLKRVRVIHGSWERCMNMHYGDKGKGAAVFFDPPYVAFEKLYRDSAPVALDVAKWCASRPEVRIALCGHVGDYTAILPDWSVANWDRGRLTYGGDKTTANEAIYFSPACRRVQ